MKKKIWLLMVLIGLIITLINNCKKDEKVSKKIPVITWENPADITNETLLSITQLNATANVDGNFVYTPDVGSRLNIGDNQTLKVNFTPTDMATNDTVSKTVKINVIAPTVSDIDGNIYHIITIGTQIWMAENLKTTKYNDGTTLPQVTDVTVWAALTTPAYCYFNNDVSYKTLSGALYNWYVVDSASNGSKNVCPVGWHIPSDNEWTKMENFLIANGYNYDGTTNGDRFTNNNIAKALAIRDGWMGESPATISHGAVYSSYYPEKQNATGFSAKPAGTGLSISLPPIANILYVMQGYWWSSTAYNEGYAWYRDLYYASTGLYRDKDSKKCGYSIRCVRN